MLRKVSTICVLLLLSGCCFNREREAKNCVNDICSIPLQVQSVGCRTQLTRDDPANCFECGTGISENASPYDINEDSIASGDFLQLSLQDCIYQALVSSRIMRDLGATVLRSPNASVSAMDPALVFSDPLRGEEAALSVFDANFFASNIFEENNRRSNNAFFGNSGFFEQYLNTTQVGVSKRTASGGIYTLRNVTVGDNNNQLSNSLGRQSWESFFELEMRQKLLQGAGTAFNRIGGPNAAPGQLNGVLIARTRTDQSLEQFRISIRDLVADVENAYWDLYYAYRDLEAKIQVRDIAKSTWELRKEKLGNDESAGNVAQAAEQYYRFQADTIDALNGRTIDGTRTNNGASGGTFRGSGGVRIAERRLRMLIGLPINDGLLIEPSDSPTVAPVIFDWQSGIQLALRNREELRRQKWVIKQRELELIANRNFLKPNLELVSQYRLRGLGNTLYGPFAPSSGALAGTSQSFFDGQQHEWALGLEFDLPVGFRQARAAVRNSELALAREIEVLREQERQVHLGLSNAIGEAKRAYETMGVQEKRLASIIRQLDAIEEKSKAGEPTALDVELDTHRRLLDARLRFHQSQVEYAISLRNVYYEQGNLLHYNNVQLSESALPSKALKDASNRDKRANPSKDVANRDPNIARQ